MDMTTYIKEMEFAVTDLIKLIWTERQQLPPLLAQIKALEKVVESNYQRAEFVAANADDPDDAAMASGMYWLNYFGEDKELFYKSKDRDRLLEQIQVHQFSVDALSGALFQYAKQGLSLVHGALAHCPPGRMIGAQPLRDVIWQARNQAMHWEEGNFKQPVVKCFTLLSADFDPKFDDYTKRSMGFEVIQLLGWTDFTKFRDDMRSLS